MAGPARVFTIPPAAPFLATLAHSLLDGTILPGHRFRDDPSSLADLTIYLPTRRAARALAGAFLDALGGGAVLLPRIRPLGDVGADEEDLADPLDLALPPVIPPADRLLALARLILDWRRRIAAERLLSPAGHPIAVPASVTDALHLARDLLALLDQAANEGVDWRRLAGLVPDDHAAWWQMTLTFLTIATEAWPQHLAERGAIDPVDRRVRVTRAIAERLDRTGSRLPVIAAGSTGSLPATAALLAAIARLPNGAVVLPGLDLDLDQATFQGLSAGSDPGHPQAALARLLATFGIDRESVAQLGSVSPAAAARARIVSEALRPAAGTDRWPAVVAGLDAAPAETAAALDGVSLVVAANEAEEALAIAAALRETLETPGATAALVTPDRALARRVCAELARFGLAAEDSAGEPLALTPAGGLALIVADCIAGGLAPDRLTALLKHPLARFGLPLPAARAAARALELAVLRGPRLAAGSAALVEAATAAGRPGEDRLGFHPVRFALGAERLRSARDLARAVREAAQPLETLAAGGSADLRDWVAALRAAMETIAADEDGSPDALYAGAAGTVLGGFLDDLAAAEAPPLAVTAGDLPGVLAALMADSTVRRPVAPGRLSIWGPLEARMMAVDRLVVGGLNEGAWPPATDTGPWLSRPMRGALDFGPPEQRIGLSAHDFTQSLGGRDVVLTRSGRRDGAPTVPTRFLQRLTGLVGTGRSEALAARGARFTDWARRIDDGPTVARAARPNPAPSPTARPTGLSVTEIETWIRDPYAIYARRVLKLEPLPDLGERPDFGTRGTLLHDALADFARDWTGRPFDDAAVTRLIEIGAGHFAALDPYPDLKALWWPRFRAAAAFVVRRFEAGRSPTERLAEQKGTWRVEGDPLPFVLTGRADRIDILADGRLSIVDFKSGAAPSDRQIATLKAPQLPLEAVIAARGGFPGLAPAATAELVHVILRGVAGKDEVRPYAGYNARGLARTLDETIEGAAAALVALVAAYRDPARGYLSRAHPFRSRDRGRYDHLARVAEWSIGDDGDGEDGES